MKYLLDFSNPPPTKKKGQSDADPIIIADVKAESFRHFLLALLGRPGDPDYMCLLTEAKDDRTHNPTTFNRYLDIGDLAGRFGIADLTRWAWAQLGFLLKSADHLAGYEWDKPTLLKMLLNLDRLSTSERASANELFCFIQLTLSMSTESPLIPRNQPKSNLDACVQLYKDPSLLGSQAKTVIFGYVFAFVLSLGHRSAAWTTQLTRDDRAIMYAAQAHLVSLRQDTKLDLAWLEDPRGSVLLEGACSACLNHFDSAWAASFGQCTPLNSAIPLEDICKVVYLPQYRQIFARIVRADSWDCKSQCAEALLKKLDGAIAFLFFGLAQKHQHFAKNA